MAHEDQPRAKTRVIDARKRAGLMWPSGLADRAVWLRGFISHWALAEVAPGRLVPWLPVAFGFGIVAYFTADREPAWWAASSVTLIGVVIVIMARRRALGFAIALGIAAMAAGFAIATLKTKRIAHPVLQFPIASAAITGFVEIREERERSDRIVVRVHSIEARRLDEAPDRVRVAVRKGTAPAVGSFIELKAHLSPPLAPLRPGGYDFARDMYFQRIGASGYAIGKIKTVEAPVSPNTEIIAAPMRSAAPDATPRRDDLEIGD